MAADGDDVVDGVTMRLFNVTLPRTERSARDSRPLTTSLERTMFRCPGAPTEELGVGIEGVEKNEEEGNEEEEVDGKEGRGLSWSLLGIT